MAWSARQSHGHAEGTQLRLNARYGKMTTSLFGTPQRQRSSYAICGMITGAKARRGAAPNWPPALMSLPRLCGG